MSLLSSYSRRNNPAGIISLLKRFLIAPVIVVIVYVVCLTCMDFMPPLRGNPQEWIRDFFYGNVEEPQPVYLSSKQGFNVSAELDFALKEKLLSANALRMLKKQGVLIHGFYHVSKWYLSSC